VDLMIYDVRSMEKLAVKAGVKDINAFSNKFLLSLVLPFLVLKFSPLASAVLFLVMLRLPHLVLWYIAKERRKKIQSELPLFIFSLRWNLDSLPLPEAMSKSGSGEITKIMSDFSSRYERGEDFEKALKSVSVFPELDELSKRLFVIYRTGGGQELLGLYAGKISSENLSRIRRNSAKMELFAVAYTTFSSVLPAVYSGINIFSGNAEFSYVALAVSLALVMMWKAVG
jgi:hypothetical protein